MDAFTIALVAGLLVTIFGWLVRDHELLGKISRWIRPPWDGRNRGQIALVVGWSVISIVALYTEVFQPSVSVDPPPRELTDTYIWITYDPRQFDPSEPMGPSVRSMERDLDWIKEAGFTGIITFGSNGALAEVPELADERDLAVIMGVWNPKDRDEITTAISKRSFVVGYSVGHNKLDRADGYSIDELKAAVQLLRSETGRPVSTTAPLEEYFSKTELFAIGDWLFPDAHLTILDGEGQFAADAIRDAQDTLKEAQEFRDRPERGEKPVLLKMVTYPMAGIEHATREQQTAFFTWLFDARKLGRLPSIAVHSAFDMSWKTGEPFNPWDPFTGLFSNDGKPRPAVKIIVDKSRE